MRSGTLFGTLLWTWRFWTHRSRNESAVNVPDRTDFKKIIAEIESAGITTYKLCLMMHRDKKQIRRWKEGQEPRHYEGVMLLMIHAEYASTAPDSSQPDTREMTAA